MKYLADDEIKTVADVAGRLAALYKNGASTKVFDGGAAVTVTNSGKETGIELAAGFGCALSGLSLFEKNGRDFANSATLATLFTAGCADVIAVRDCEYAGKSSGYIRRLSACIKESCADGRKPCVINLGSDEDSPLQTISDLSYLAQRFGGTVGQIAETADCFIDFLACFLRHLVRRPFIHGAGDCCL